MRILLLFFILPCLNLSGQPGFNQTYILGEGSAGFENILLYKDTLVMHGTCIVKNVSPFEQAAMLLWADTNGNILKSRFYFDSLGRDFLFSYGEPFIRLNDNSGYLLSVNVRKNGVLMKVNHNGDVISLTEYVDNTTITDFYRRIIEVEDGFYVIGNKQRLDYQMDGFVMKLDKNGKKRWEKYFDGYSRQMTIGSFLPISDNEFIIGLGTSTRSNTPLDQWNYSGQILFTDSLINVKKQWESAFSLEHSGINGIRQTSNENICYITARTEVFPIEKYAVHQPKIVLRDKNFNLLLERPLGIANHPLNRLYNTVASPDGNFVSSGQMAVNDNRPTLAGWIYKMTPEGDSIWSVLDTLFYNEGGYAEHYLTGTVVLPSGSIIASGSVDVYKGNAGKSWAWLLKVSKDGCVEASNCIPISALENQNNKQEVMVYPNPANTLIYFNSPEQIQWESVELIDLSGRTVSKIEYPTENRIDIKNVSSGIYFVRFKKSNKFVIKKVDVIK